MKLVPREHGGDQQCDWRSHGFGRSFPKPTHSTRVLARRASRCPIAVLRCLRCRRLFRVRYMFGDHPRWHGINRGPADFGLRGETVSFTSQDGIALKAWWLLANGTPRGAVIIATGSITRDKSCCRVQLFSSMWWAKFVLLGLGNACTSLPTPEHQRTEHRDVVPTTSLDHLFCRRIFSLRARIRR